MLVVLETVVATAGQDVTVGFVLVNDRGLVVASGAGSTDTGRYTFPVDVGPGKYVLKAAGVEAGGRQGSVERRFDATLGGSGDIRVSDFILAQPSDALIPSVVRVSSDRLVGYLELYAPANWSPADGSVTIAITTPDDPAPLLSVPAEIGGAGAGRWVVRAVLPLSDLPPGRYLACARLTIAGLSAEPLVRPFVVAER